MKACGTQRREGPHGVTQHNADAAPTIHVLFDLMTRGLGIVAEIRVCERHNKSLWDTALGGALETRIDLHIAITMPGVQKPHCVTNTRMHQIARTIQRRSKSSKREEAREPGCRAAVPCASAPGAGPS